MHERRDGWTLLYATLFALSFVGYPFLSSVLGAFDAYARVFSIVYRAFVLLGSIYLIRIAVLRTSGEDWRGVVVGAFCALWVMLLARFAWDSSFVPIPLPLEWFELLLQMVGVVLIPTVALFHAPSERAFDIARRMILAGGVVASLFLVVAVLRIIIEQDSVAVLRRLGTEELNPITLGHIGTSVVIVALLGHPLRGARSWVARVIDSRTVRVTAGVIGGFLAIAAASKGPIVALVGVIVLWQTARLMQAGSARALFVAITRLTFVFALMVAFAIFLALFANVGVVDRFADITVDASTSYRVISWRQAMLMFESSPLWGAGFVEIKNRFYPHNIFIETLMAVGIPGLFVLCLVLVPIMTAGIRLLFTRYDWMALLLAQQLIGMLFSGSVYFSAQFWGTAAAALALDRLTRQAPSTKPDPVSGHAVGAH